MWQICADTPVMPTPIRTPDHHEPRAARVSSRLSGEGPPVTVPARVSPPARPATLAGQLLRHALVAPEKKTLKRIEALRTAIVRGCDDRGHFVDVDSAAVAIVSHLRADRGLDAALDAAAIATLSSALLDIDQRSTAAATIVGRFLRAAGGIERSAVTPERVKAALLVINDALYDFDNASAPIPAAVREVKVEKRDGGLQLVAQLRQGADDESVRAALSLELKNAGYGDIDIRTERPVVVVAAVRVRPSANW